MKYMELWKNNLEQLMATPQTTPVGNAILMG